MSRLKLYWPDQETPSKTASPSAAATGESVDEMIVPFRLQSDSHASHLSVLDVVTRAQTLRENRECRQCGHPVVEPVELNDGALNQNGLPIPGTATLVGFHCTRCDREWPV